MAFRTVPEAAAVELAWLNERLAGVGLRRELLKAQFMELARQEQDILRERQALLEKLGIPLDGSVGVVSGSAEHLPRGTLVDARTGSPLVEVASPVPAAAGNGSSVAPVAS